MGIPAYRGQVHYGHVMQMMSMSALCMAARETFAMRGFMAPESCSVDWSRNQLVYHGMRDEDCDWVLMMDADTFCARAEPVLRMLHTAAEERPAVIAAPVIIRGKQAYNVLDAEDNHNIPREEWANKVCEIDRVGTACMAISTKWMRANWPESPWFETKQLPGPVPSKVGEDINFCDGVRSRGGRILLDGRFEPIHVDGGRPMQGK